MTRRSSRLQSKTPAPEPTPDLETPIDSPPLSSDSDQLQLDDEALEVAQAMGWGGAFLDLSPSESSNSGERPSLLSQGWEGVLLDLSDDTEESEIQSPGNPPVALPPDSPDPPSDSE